MKRIMVMLFAAVLLLCGQALAQNIVHYNVDAKKLGGIPDLKGTIVGISFVGNLSEETKMLLMKKLGVRDFTEGPAPCMAIDRPVICIKISAPYSGGQVSGSDSSSFSGSGASMSGSGSYSGDLYTTPVHIELRGTDGSVTLLGSAYVAALAGNTNSGGSFGGNSFSGSSYSTANLPVALAVGRSAQLGIYQLFKSKKGWMPGAREAVRAAYGQQPKK